MTESKSKVFPRIAGLVWLLPALCVAPACGPADDGGDEVISQALTFTPPALPTVVKNVASGLYLDVSGASTASGAQVVTWTFNGNANQDWQMTPMGNGWYEIVSRSSGKCLDVPNNSTSNGQTLQQWDCSGRGNQLFSLQTLNGNVQIVGQASGKCVQASSQGAGAVIWDCGTATSQQWSVTVAPSNVSLPSLATVQNASNSRYLDVSGVSTSAGAQVWVWSYTGGANQIWSFQSMSDGSYELISKNSGQCLDVPNNSTTTGQTLEQWTCWGGTNQRYYLYALGNKVQIAEQGSSKCLSSNGQTDGAAVTIQPCNATDTAQQWSIAGQATAQSGPCDLYATGGTPCAAAYSTVRALYGSYGGSLYQVRRADSRTQDIGVLTPGGVANAATQDTFCSGTPCTISIIYDQSGKGNHLTKAPGGSAVYGPNPDVEAVANALPTTIAGHKAYGVHVTPAPSCTSPGQVGYRNTATRGIATGDQPESIYMVTDGTYTNGACCFDFGNAEMQPVAGGYGTMDALYFGNNNWWDKGAGNGPWVMADLEVGVYSMGGPSAYSDANKSGNRINNNDLSLTVRFVTAMLKSNSATATTGGPFTLKGGNAQSGVLTTMWDGARPVGYETLHKLGGIVLGVGGDNSSTAQGNFYEGVVTTGYASTATDNAVQANIVAAGYGR